MKNVKKVIKSIKYILSSNNKNINEKSDIMHIPDGIITIDQALIYWILTILIMAICFYKFQKDSQKTRKLFQWLF